MSFFTREQCLERLRSQIKAGRPIIGGGAGTGLSAKCAEAGGIDLIIIYNSGRFRMAGRGSLSGMMPYGDANAIVMDMAREVLPTVKKTPVLAGVCGQVLLVVRAGATPQQAVVEAVQLLGEERSVSLLLNQSDDPASRGYYQHYGDEDSEQKSS